MFTRPLMKLLKSMNPCTELKGALGISIQLQIPADASSLEICQTAFYPFDMCSIAIIKC